MALAPKKTTVTKTVEVCKCDHNKIDAQIEILTAFMDEVLTRIKALEEGSKPKEHRSINKVEIFNGEAEPEKEISKMVMNDGDKIMSMRNAIKILPPNLIEEGRHVRSNIEAICGFKIDEDMMNAAYEGFTHE